MNLYFKFILLIIKRLLFKRRQRITETCVSHFRVGFMDMDLNFHMNNGRFFSVMDLGRFDLLMRTGTFLKLFSNGYYPVVLSESMVFKKSLGYWDAYQVHTCLESWDKDFFYITQKFYRKDQIVASGNIRGCFKKRGKKGIVKIKDLFEFIGEPHSDVELTAIASKQIELDNVLLPREKKARTEVRT